MQTDILARYELAQKIMKGVLSNSIVMNDAVFPHWIEGSHSFWYQRETRNGKQFRLVDADEASNMPAFDHQALANALQNVAGYAVNHQDLTVTDVAIALSPLKVYFKALNRCWLFDDQNLQEVNSVSDKLLRSLDGSKAIFVHEYNIWVRDEASGIEKDLTKDGVVDYCYARSQVDSNKIQALWSPDSKCILTVQLDTREIASRPFVQYVPQDGSLHPEFTQTKLAYPGDKHVETYRLVSIDVNSGHVQEANYNPITVSLYGEEAFGFFDGKPLGWWLPDSRHAVFVDLARGAKTVRVIEFDTHTGNTRMLFEETADTFVRLCHSNSDIPLFLPLPESAELIWFSERTGWGHLYLYDLNTGELKNPITEGEWLVREVLHYDARRREMLIQTAGRDQDISPYYRDICKVNIDTGIITQLAFGNFEYLVYQPHTFTVCYRNLLRVDQGGVSGVSPCGEYIVTTRSRVDMAPVSVLIDREGVEILTLEDAEVSGLPSDWHWPEPVKVKSADGKTGIYGVVYRPPGFNPDKSYPVLDFSCGMRNYSAIPQGSFINGPVFDYTYALGASLASLGFIVVALEGRGTPYRDKAFQDHHYGDIAYTSDFDDRVSGLRQLSQRYPYMDLERVGITGLDNLANTVYGLFNYSDFYSVGVVHCLLEPEYWFAQVAEQYYGVPINKTTIPDARYTEAFIGSFKGKLLLIQGMQDYMTPSSTFRLVEALQRANKDFDMLCMPSLGHGITGYTLRRNWDYLVTHLQGLKPPEEFHLITGLEVAINTHNATNS